ncbi:MAG: glycosyltransferase [Verrucomicrobia bacterium]|nr:glycosyltransferase [Verrucomicrobiota bacterium]
MRFLFVESSRSWGGQEYRTCLEVNWLNQHSHAAWLACDPASDVFARANELGTRAVPFRLRSRFSPLTSFRLWRFCRRYHIDVVKTFSSKAHWLTLPLFWLCYPVTRVRCITDPLRGRRAFVYRHGCSRILVDAPVIKRQLIADNGIAPAKIEVVGSAVDLARFRPDVQPAKLREELGIPASSEIIVNVGMIRPDKGQVLLVEAAALVLRERPDAHFVLVGEGTGLRKKGARVREAIARAGLAERVHMLGYRWDIPEIMAGADVVAIASLHTEASPIVLREALACGRPLVATRVGDVDEVIRDREHGLIVEPGNATDLARGILEMLNDRTLARRCADNGSQLARAEFSFDKMMQGKLRVDEEVASGRGERAPILPAAS